MLHALAFAAALAHPALVPGQEGCSTVRFEVTLAAGEKASFEATVKPEWAPLGAARLQELVRSSFFTEARFFRVISGFMAQFGISGSPEVAAKWREASLKDDPVVGSNTRGTMSFAMAGPNTRTTQLFINFVDNTNLDGSGFAPIAAVSEEGMKVVDRLYSVYGEGAPSGNGPDQGRIQEQGNAYLKKDFPNLSYIDSATCI